VQSLFRGTHVGHLKRGQGGMHACIANCLQQGIREEHEWPRGLNMNVNARLAHNGW
jgi:hypothetical protein